MRKRLLCIVLLTAMFLSTIPTANGAAPFVDPQYAAERLYYYGLFKGTENGFELDRGLTRLEALVMIIRLEYEGYLCNDCLLNYNGKFKDVPAWGVDYVAHGYGVGLMNGISETMFGSYDNITEEQFVTLLLRLLSYRDSFWVFNWDNPWSLAQEIGLVNPGEYPKGAFTRGDAAKLCYRALSLSRWGYERQGLSDTIYRHNLLNDEGNEQKWSAFGQEFTCDNLYLNADTDNVYVYLARNETFTGYYWHYGEQSDRVEVISSNESVVRCSVNELSDGGFYIYHYATGTGRTYVRINLLDVWGNIKDFVYLYVQVS